MYYIAKSVVASLPLGTDSEKEQHDQARIKANANLRRLDKSRRGEDSEDDSAGYTDGSKARRKEEFDLDQYESQIAMELVAPEDIPVGFDGEPHFKIRDKYTRLIKARYWWPR
jgi:hypothetical protein